MPKRRNRRLSGSNSSASRTFCAVRAPARSAGSRIAGYGHIIMTQRWDRLISERAAGSAGIGPSSGGRTGRGNRP